MPKRGKQVLKLIKEAICYIEVFICFGDYIVRNIDIVLYFLLRQCEEDSVCLLFTSVKTFDGRSYIHFA